MGRGRNNGPIDQSTKKPKIRKNKERGGNLQVFQPHCKQEKFSPFLLSEGLLAEMKKMSPQNLMNILLPNNVNRDISYSFKKKRQPATNALIKGKDFQTLPRNKNTGKKGNGLERDS